uniref:Ionotropic glutamate receptor L-glutamate and glycine-binding domain-containing protein n=1 Tax=Anopheles epiroticus TaxID=199890 RepID=A0A182PTG0_9DIPT
MSLRSVSTTITLLMVWFLSTSSTRTEVVLPQVEMEQQTQQPLPDIITGLLMRYFRHPFQPVQFFWSASSASHRYIQVDLMTTVLWRTSGHLVVTFANPEASLQSAVQQKRSHAVLFGEDVDAFERLLANFSTFVNDYSGRYLLVLTGATPTLSTLVHVHLRQLFRALWQRHIVHVNVLVQTNSSIVRAYTYVPYSSQHCGKPVVRLAAILPSTGQQHHLYPPLTSLHNCTLQVGTFEAKPYTILQRKVDGFIELGGFEGDMLQLLAHRLQFRVNVTESPHQLQWGVIGAPGNSTGTMQLVQDEQVDLVIACMALDVTRGIYLKAGWAHYTSRILFAVPQGHPYSAFEKLFRPFGTDVWLALGALLLCVVGVVGGLSMGRRARSLRRFVYGPAVRMPLLDALYLLWGGAIVTVSSRNFARSLLAHWLGFTFVMRTLYQGSLYLYLQRSANYPPIATLEQIHHSTLHYYMVNIAMRFFVDRPEIRPRVRFIPPGLDTLGGQVAGMASRYTDRVVVCPQDMVAYNNRLTKRTGRPIQVTRESITLFPLSIYYPKKSCLTALFDRQVGRIVQSGLVDLWVRNYGDYDFEESRRESSSGGEPSKLTLVHLAGAYQLLVGMHTLAMVVFLLELLSLRLPRLRAFLTLFLPVLGNTTSSNAVDGSKRLLVRETVGNHFSEVIVDALTRYYVQNHSSTMVMRLSTIGQRARDLQSDIMDEVMQRTSHSIAYEFWSKTTPSRRPRIFNIAFIDGVHAFEQLFHALDPAHNDFSGYYLIVLTEPSTPTLLERIFALLWTLNVINVNVITADLEDQSHWQSVLMHTYYPYRAGACERPVPHLLHRFRRGKRLDVSVELFPPKLENFHRCPVTVGTFHLPPYVLLHRGAAGDKPTGYGGFEGDLLRALSIKLNFTVRLIEPEMGELWGRTPSPNQSADAASGCVRLVLSERANLTLGRFAIRGDRNLVMKSSRSYYTVRMVLAVPAGRAYTPFEKLFRPFSRPTWVLVTLYLVVGVVVIGVIRLSRLPPYVRHFVYGRSVSTPLLNLLNVLFGGALLRLPTRNFARTLLLLWLYYCLVVRTCYQGSLYEYLQERKNFSPLQTVDAMVAHDYRFYSLHGASHYLEQLTAILPRITWLSDDDANVERQLLEMASHRAPASALFTDVERVAYHNRYRVREGLVHVANVVLVRLPIGIYYPLKSCLTNQFNSELDGLLASGYVNYRLERYVNYDMLKGPVDHEHLPTPLTIDQLEGCYETLVGLLLVATGLLLLELASRWIVPLRTLLTFLQSE